MKVETETVINKLQNQLKIIHTDNIEYSLCTEKTGQYDSRFNFQNKMYEGKSRLTSLPYKYYFLIYFVIIFRRIVLW